MIDAFATVELYLSHLTKPKTKILEINFCQGVGLLKQIAVEI